MHDEDEYLDEIENESEDYDLEDKLATEYEYALEMMREEQIAQDYERFLDNLYR